MNSRMKEFFRILLLVAMGLALGLSVSWFAGESPLRVARVLWHSAFGSPYDFGMTLFYTTPLLLTGLAVALPFRAGLFNIGAEGQLQMGALACAAFAILAPGLPSPVAPILAGLAAFLAGAFWGWIPGWIRARRGGHEVITTIMMNFIAAGVASYLTLYRFRNPDSQNPETAIIAEAFQLKPFAAFGEAPVTWALPFAILLAVLLHLFLARTLPGFAMRATGENERAARFGGMDPGRVRMLTMALAGGIAGLVGIGEVLGNAHRFRLGFSAEYGFTGIAVALVARGSPFGVILSAFLFGALHKGAGDLEMETERMNRDLAMILQAMVLLLATADALFRIHLKSKRKEGES